MKNIIKRRWFIVACGLVICGVHARLGDGPSTDEMFRDSDAVYAGRYTGYDFVTIGQTSIWLVAEFTIDHVIKGNIATNKIGILRYPLDKPDETNEVRRSMFPIEKMPRCLFFLKKIDSKAFQYKQIDDLNGMIPVCQTKPSVPVSADAEKRLLIELNRAYDTLPDEGKEFLEYIGGDWLKARKKPEAKEAPSRPQ